MSQYWLIPALLGVAFLGWVAGMWTFKRSLTWCNQCGSTLACPDCQRAGLNNLSAGARSGGRRA